jgi:hypothetical protein
MAARTRTEAIESVEYNIRYFLLHRRFHANAAKWVTFIELSAGSAAVVSALGDFRVATVISGIAIALMAAANHAWSFSDRARDFHDLERAAVKVLANASGKTSEEIDSERDLACIDGPPCMEGLRRVAQFDVWRQTGQDAFVEEELKKKPWTIWERFVRMIV